ASMLVACVSKVDLPMPGSPPTNSTEPRTKPPPVTRSSSVMPEGRRGASLLLPVRLSSANVRPLRRERTETGIEVAPVVSSSLSVFHSPQESHFPCQRLYAAPQFWQTKERVDLAMMGNSSLGGAGGGVLSTNGSCGAMSARCIHHKLQGPTLAHVQMPTGCSRPRMVC